MPEDHVIGSGMSDEDLRLASFWLRNRLFLRRLGYGSLIFIAAVCWLFVLWSLLDAYAISYPRESRIPGHIIQNQLSVQGLAASAPSAIQPSEVSVFDTTDNRKDFLVQLTNNNTMWWADFDYHFDIAGQQTPTRQGYILPSSQRYLTELGYTPTTTSRTARFVVENIRWHRINPAMVNGDYKSFADARLQFGFDNIAYAHDLTLGTNTIGQTTLTFSNNSAYGYWNVDLTVILYRGTSPVGVTTIAEREVKPGQQIPVNINWFDNLGGVSKTDVQANVNILDPASYLPTTNF
ncbi:MAG TPA: hypothetical protein VMU11_00425 [Verrucomicrobiae bacterium]|nr:hypothetical protein [Verrucomicrobiae bacterium]